MLGRVDDALGCFEQVIPVFRDLGDTAGLAEALYGLGMVHSEHGRDGAAGGPGRLSQDRPRPRRGVRAGAPRGAPHAQG
jgi:hypothetical protein